jgi:hypothetical protein
MKTEIKFDNFANMIKERARYYAKYSKMEYEDIVAYGFVIYSVALTKFDASKASFSTYLYQFLSGHLLSYCKRDAKKRKHEVQLQAMPDDLNINRDFDFDIFPAREHSPLKEQFLLYAKYSVSKKAYNVLEWVLDTYLDGFRSKSNPSLVSMAKKLSIDLSELKLIWQELSDFWNHSGAAFYAEGGGGELIFSIDL